MHFIVKVLYADDDKFTVVCITHKKDIAMDVAQSYASFDGARLVEVYRETLVERVKSL